jgi:hypothetical protein
MGKKNKKIRKRCVTGKVIHVTREAAGIYQRQLRGGWEILESYQCNKCNGWHLGHPIGSKKKNTLEPKLTEGQKAKKKRALRDKMKMSELQKQDYYFSK